ncbi:MAG: DUF3368 domain-containing protein [Deltaproteobacteria bacterium]|nr:DUF3368 domain-containing protein [Deltaproteobacteria bacterium]
MPDAHRELVINTTPLIALAVATGGLDVLRICYDRVLVPNEVEQEILASGPHAPGVADFTASPWLERSRMPQEISSYLRNSLDRGEAAVIQAALHHELALVCIDEKMGRRAARLHGLVVTGSAGILVKAKRLGFPLDIPASIARLKRHGIWLGKDVEQFLLREGY